MSKKKKWLVSILAVILVVCVGIGLFGKRTYYRLYNGDRITINLYVTINGEKVSTENEKFKIEDIKVNSLQSSSDERENSAFKLYDNGDFLTIGAKAGSYGEYDFDVVIDGYHFTLYVYQFDWWDVQESNLHIDINTEDDTYETYEDYSYISGNDFYKTIHDSENVQCYDLVNMNEIRIGCKG